MEIIFDVRDSEDGGYSARARLRHVYRGGNLWEELRKNVPDAVWLHFEEVEVRPRLVQLRYVKNELFRVEAV